MQLTKETAQNLLNREQVPASDGGCTIAPDSCLDENIRIEQLIGRGANGEVYRARQGAMDRQVAVKTLRPEALAKKEHLARFFREARVMSTLDHPNIARIYALGVGKNGQPYFVLDYVAGRSLKELIQQNEIQSESQLLALFEQILSALSHAHEKGVVHRDLKPQNLLVSENAGKPQIFIIDFGIARFIHEVPQGITRTGAVFGSPLYMSPEQCMGKPADARSDIYALGCILYEIVTGAAPHAGLDAVRLMSARLEQSAPQIGSKTKFPVSAKLMCLIATALQRDPADRYQTAKEMLGDLTRVANNEPLARVTAKKVPSLRFRPSRLAARIASVMFGVFIVIGAVAYLEYQRQQQLRNHDLVDHARSLVERAMIRTFFHKRGEADVLFAQAAVLYERAGGHRQDLQEIYLERGKSAVNGGHPDTAIEHLTTALSYSDKVPGCQDLSTAEIKYYLGWMQLCKGQLRTAIPTLFEVENYYNRTPDDTSKKTRQRIMNLERLIFAENLSTRYDISATLFPKLLDAQMTYGVSFDHMAATQRDYAEVLAKLGNAQEAQKHRALAADLESCAVRTQ